MRSWNTDDLLASIREQGRIPDSDPDATDAKLLLAADRQMVRDFIPAVRDARGEYYVTSEDQPIYINQSEYVIPARAMTSTLRSVVWIDTANREWELPPIPLSDRFIYTLARGIPTAYTIEDDRVVLLPKPYSSQMGTLRLYFEVMPAQLVPVSDCALVQSIATNGTITTGGVPGTWADPTPGPATQLDWVCGNSPFSTLASNTSIVTLASPALTLPSLPARYPAGTAFSGLRDYLCPTGYSCVPQIPAEFHPLLAASVAAQWLLPIDAQASATLRGDVQAGIAVMKDMFTPRQIGRQQKIHTRSSMMRRGKRRGRGFLGTF